MNGKVVAESRSASNSPHGKLSHRRAAARCGGRSSRPCCYRAISLRFAA